MQSTENTYDDLLRTLDFDEAYNHGATAGRAASAIRSLSTAIAAERDRADRAETKISEVDAWLITQNNHLPGSAIDDLVAIIDEATA